MQRGKRKSPFVGSSEALVSDTGPILYYRYSNLSDILVEGSAPLAPAQLAVGGDGTAQEGAKKKPKREKVKKVKPEGEANGAQKQQPKQKKPKGPRKLAPEERVSGPGNAGEALAIREALGFVPSTAEELAEAEAAAKRAAAKPAFTFGFGLGGSTPAAAAAAPAAQPAPAAAAVASRGGSESSVESESGSESDNEGEGGQGVEDLQGAGASSSSESESDSESEEEAPAGGAAAAAPGGGKGGSSSDSEDDSSSSESDTGSDSEDEKKGAAPAGGSRAAPAQPAPAALPAAAAAAAAEDEDGEYVPRRVYVGGMPFSYTEDKVHEYWSYCGEIESMDLMTFPDTGRFRGIVFITFADQEGFNAAMACDGEQCDGQTLKVQRCKWSPKERAARDRARAAAAATGPGAGSQRPGQAPAPAQQGERQHQTGGSAGAPSAAAATGGPGGGQRQQGGAAAAPKTEGYNVAYVGNIAFEADEKELLRLFEPYNVTKVRLHTDKDTGRSKGFAHIHFKDAESLDGALALNGTQLHGRKIKMGYAQPKKGQ